MVSNVSEKPDPTKDLDSVIKPMISIYEHVIVKLECLIVGLRSSIRSS
jgi:hypothetical protein